MNQTEYQLGSCRSSDPAHWTAYWDRSGWSSDRIINRLRRLNQDGILVILCECLKCCILGNLETRTCSAARVYMLCPAAHAPVAFTWDGFIGTIASSILLDRFVVSASMNLLKRLPVASPPKTLNLSWKRCYKGGFHWISVPRHVCQVCIVVSQANWEATWTLLWHLPKGFPAIARDGRSHCYCWSIQSVRKITYTKSGDLRCSRWCGLHMCHTYRATNINLAEVIVELWLILISTSMWTD